VRRIRRVAMIAAVAAAVAAPWWGPAVLRRFAFFEVRRIEVVGARYLAPATIIGALGLEPHASVWSDLGAVERRVGSLAGIASVRISRRLPATVRIVVTEVDPVAMAAGPSGLVPVGADGRPLPYDPAAAPVDVPVVQRAAQPLIAALAAVESADPALYADVATARGAAGAGGGEAVALELDGGRLLLETPVDPAVVWAVSAVRRDLESRGRVWRELDGRFRGWVVVRGATGAPSARVVGPAARRRARGRGRGRAA